MGDTATTNRTPVRGVSTRSILDPAAVPAGTVTGRRSPVLGGSTFRGGRAALLVALVAVLAAALAGTASATRHGAQAKGPKPLSKAAWKALVAKAKQEGSVTLYTVQNPTGLQAMAAAFKQLYGINVTVNRQVDNTLVSQINAEESTGKAVADIWVPSAKGYVFGALKNGWVVDAVGPNFFSKKFDRKSYMLGKSWITGEAVLGMAWNTQGYKGTIGGASDFTTSAFSGGKLGVPDARVSPSFMDWYLWLEAKYGKNILQKLAAQNPKIYTSTLPMTQAVASGEIIGAPCAAGTAVTLKSSGAPIEYKVLPDEWNAPYYGLILKQAPHPAAAQLLANFMQSPQGQALADGGFGAIYPNVPGTYYVKPRIIRLNDFTKAKVDAFNAQWASLFTH
jgi:iron(III) transport system substrate-binding protein